MTISKFLVIVISCLALFLMSCQNKVEIEIETIEELERELHNYVEKNDIISISYCVVKNDMILHSGGIGLADIDNNFMATDNTIYLTASISKTITAVALMQLVEQNLIDLDDDISAFLPYTVRNPHFPNDKITYRMLLSHTSSIIDDFQEQFDPVYCYDMDCPMTLEEYFNDIFNSSGSLFSEDNFSNNAPGTKEDYSNLASALVGYLVERITQTQFDEYCKTHIFSPLGMTKTEWRLENIIAHEIAIPYDFDIDNNTHYTFPDYPNGGLRTHVIDLSKFLRAIILNGTLHGAQLLTSASMVEMKTFQFGSNEQCLSFYFETINGKKYLGHSGGELGTTAEMYFDINSNVGVIAFSNEEDAPLDYILSLMFNYGEKQ